MPVMRPLIGCSTYPKVLAQDPPIHVFSLMTSYIDAIKQAGGVPIMIPLGLSHEDLQVVFARIDGLLLPGGGDIEPKRYNGNGFNANLRDVSPLRDEQEIWLAQAAVREQKPLLAICRGLQVFNVALGGTLWEDINDQTRGGLEHDYYERYPRNYLPHTVAIEPDSRLAATLGKTQSRVNSLHHQGIRDLAPALAAVAVAPDGLIEGVEVSDHPFALAVQWHPENLIADDPAMLDLFRGLTAAASVQHALAPAD